MRKQSPKSSLIGGDSPLFSSLISEGLLVLAPREGPKLVRKGSSGISEETGSSWAAEGPLWERSGEQFLSFPCHGLYETNTQNERCYTGGGVKQGRFGILRFPLFCSVWGFQDNQMLGKTAREMSLSRPFCCASNASKNLDLRAVSPYASRQSTGKMPNRPHFAHIQVFPLIALIALGAFFHSTWGQPLEGVLWDFRPPDSENWKVAVLIHFPKISSYKRKNPVLPFLVFLEFLVFFCCEDFLVFLSVFPFFSRDFRGSVGIKNPCFFGGFPCRFPKKQGKEGQGSHHPQRILGNTWPPTE